MNISVVVVVMCIYNGLICYDMLHMHVFCHWIWEGSLEEVAEIYIRSSAKQWELWQTYCNKIFQWHLGPDLTSRLIAIFPVVNLISAYLSIFLLGKAFVKVDPWSMKPDARRSGNHSQLMVPCCSHYRKWWGPAVGDCCISLIAYIHYTCRYDFIYFIHNTIIFSENQNGSDVT